MGNALSNLANIAVLFAEAPAAADGEAAGPGMVAVQFLPFIAIFFIFWFLLIRPQKKEQARRQEMLSGVKKNDRVLTAGGIYGVVTNVDRDADEVTIRVDETSNTKLRMTLSSIAQILGDESASGGAANK